MNGAELDLLNPADFLRDNYNNQLRQTIAAYSDSMIVIGEAVQNALDAVCDGKPDLKKGEILINIDFDKDEVLVKDNGPGFPRDLKLLYLGGTLKTEKKSKGQIGVGIKVTLFSSRFFEIRSKLASGENWKIEIKDANKFQDLTAINVTNPPLDDATPLVETGTEIRYQFTRNNGLDYMKKFVDEVIHHCMPRSDESAFLHVIREYNPPYPSAFAALLASFLRRYSYIGDILAANNLQDRYPLNGIDVTISLKCTNPQKRFDDEIGALFNGKTDQCFSVTPSYSLVTDALAWVPAGKKAPAIFHDNLGRGGSNLQKTDGFNILRFTTQEEYESLLTNKRGHLPNEDLMISYRELLFPSINAIYLTIGRIPDFEKFLPGGSRRVISCNGVVTSHDIDLTRGRNQEYVRCFDMVIDIDANLNYGKTQLTNMHLVKRIRDYVNEAYVRVIQNATSTWVGKLPGGKDDEDDEIYVGREDLGLDEFVIRKVPKGENDVIALFFELAGKNHIPDFYGYGLSSFDKYDGKAAIKRECDDDDVLKPKDDTRLRTVEFKKEASEVLKDFDRKQKIAREIDLVIAWNEGAYQSDDYKIYDISESDLYKQSPKKVFPLVIKYIYDTREATEVQILLLDEIVKKLKRD